MTLRIAQDETADELLSTDPFALLMGMLLDQQFPMERAFAGPALLRERLGSIDPTVVASTPPEEMVTAFTGPPAIHRYPGSMAGRVQALARFVVDTHGGDASGIWRDAATGTELLGRLRALPGFGPQKAKIFVALLGKQLEVVPEGWQEVAGPYAEDGSYRSVADVRDVESLAKVRAFKKQAKTEAKARSASG